MKTLYITAAMVLLTACVYAQESIQLGIKAGLNASTIHSSPDLSYKPKTGFHAGALAHIHLNKTWALQPELMYSGQGASSSGSTIRLNYFTVPVQIQYMFDNGFRLQTGPQAGILLSAHGINGNTKTDITPSFKPLDLGWTFGASYLGASGFGLDARYNAGFTNINDAGPADLYNRTFQVGIFYLFKHKYK